MSNTDISFTVQMSLANISHKIDTFMKHCRIELHSIAYIIILRGKVLDDEEGGCILKLNADKLFFQTIL